jgi:hypothetical protein
MTTPRILTTCASLLAAAVLVAGCGGGSDFSGDAKVPDGYKTYDANGVSFVYPSDWQVASRDSGNGPTVEITPPDKTDTPYGLIQLSVQPGVTDDHFKSLSDQRRIVLRDTGNAKIESDEKVDIPGAKQALRATAKAPPGQGSDPVEVSSDSLDVLRDNDDMLVLTAAVPKRGDEKLDPKAVIDSFRVKQ